MIVFRDTFVYNTSNTGITTYEYSRVIPAEQTGIDHAAARP